jgi:hypothetical protein
MPVSFECCVLSRRDLWDGPIPRPRNPTECGVSECYREASIMRRPWPTRGCCAMGAGGGDIWWFLHSIRHTLFTIQFLSPPWWEHAKPLSGTLCV